VCRSLVIDTVLTGAIDVRLLPAKRRTRVTLFVALAATCLMLWLWSNPPWEAHCLGRPTNWWARQILAAYERYEKNRGSRSSFAVVEPEKDKSSFFPSWWKEWLTRVGLYLEVKDEDWWIVINERSDFIPVLVELLHHPNAIVRMTVAQNEHEEPEVLRPTLFALADGIAHFPKEFRNLAANSLKHHFQRHPEAFDAEVRRSVIPALFEALGAEDPQLRVEAKQALLAIDPAAARGAGLSTNP
jgi:hypothetical protein